jgi:broad specificity phosphatase PhoE
MVGVQDPRPSAIAADDALVITIVLARHGRPAWDFRTPIPGHALAEWLRGEGEAPLDPSSRPSAELERLSREAKCLVASPLRRSRDSARLLAPTADPLIDPCFREAELGSTFRSGLRLRPEMWALLARVAWFCGRSAGVESFASARERASKAALVLKGHAEESGVVVLVGHGLMNFLIARRLRAAGWRGPWLPSSEHWTFGVYERAAA